MDRSPSPGADAVLDDLDHSILRLLSSDARQGAAGIARRLGVPRSTVQERISRMERRGIIGGYTIKPGAAWDTERAVTAHVSIFIDPKLAASVMGALSRIDEVRVVHTVSGPFDAIAVVSAASPAAIDAVLDRIGTIPGVERTTSAILLATKIDR